MRLLWIGYFQPTVYGDRTDDDRLTRALERAGATLFRCEDPWKDAETQIARVEPDWVVFSKCREFSPSRVARLRAAHPGLRFTQVLFDLMDHSERRFRGIPWILRSRLTWWLPLARELDLVFMRERGQFEEYARLGVRCVYLDQASDPADAPVERAPTEGPCDVAFFGSYLPSRARTLQLLRGDRRVCVYTTNPVSWDGTGLDIRPAVFGTAFAEAIASARIVYGENATHEVEGYWSDRVYRVLGRRGFFLTRYTPGLETCFENHTHLVWGKTDQDLQDLASRYLADPAARERIREAGYRHVRAHHTYDHRAREMIQILAAEGPRRG